jgi:hypothetical protein
VTRGDVDAALTANPPTPSTKPRSVCANDGAARDRILRRRIAVFIVAPTRGYGGADRARAAAGIAGEERISGATRERGIADESQSVNERTCGESDRGGLTRLKPQAA